MFREIPFHARVRENAEKGRELFEKVMEVAADQCGNPIGRVTGALSSFRVDVIDAESAYEIFAELPGFNKEDLKVSYDENSNYLTIKAVRPENEMDVKYLCRERREGEYARTFYIDDIDKEKVNVSYDNGILHIILPKVQEDENGTVFDIN